ncbi:MAG TPA: L-rhamnose isomerase [Pirellulales bacterium]|jgi:L-rhamnose isomerase|nr:L-rhamnose isomerase [Pirellulales bacterium]
MTTSVSIDKAFELARQRYAELGVDAQRALTVLRQIPISLHCWQTDDVGGFENTLGATGGIQATGNYPGKARTADEVRQDLDQVTRLLPGRHRLALHAIYGETEGRKVPRDEVAPEQFSRWIDWARRSEMGLDFNPTFFSHANAADGFTLAHRDEGIRKFWVRHGIACRKIGEAFGRALGTPCVTNVWIPDGYKDTPADRQTPRERLRKSLDEIFAERIDPKYHLDAVESKLFGIGSESYVVGSHEFYLGYSVQKGVLLTLDAGHYHPTEGIADKISSVLLYVPEILLHVSRGVRWDSDHVVTLSDDLRSIAEEIVRAGHAKVHVGLDFFDASINRIAAYVIGTRAMLKALLLALLEPAEKLRSLEIAGDFTARLALLEELKSFPFGAVWDYYCQQQGVPVGNAWLEDVRTYEREVLSRR